MGILSNIKNNWKRGREYANALKESQKRFADADISIELIESELGPDEDRNSRYYEDARSPLKNYRNKYPQSRLKDDSLVNFIAESLPRKRKKSKPKIKKNKKCRCK